MSTRTSSTYRAHKAHTTHKVHRAHKTHRTHKERASRPGLSHCGKGMQIYLTARLSKRLCLRWVLHYLWFLDLLSPPLLLPPLSRLKFQAVPHDVVGCLGPVDENHIHNTSPSQPNNQTITNPPTTTLPTHTSHPPNPSPPPAQLSGLNLL